MEGGWGSKRVSHPAAECSSSVFRTFLLAQWEAPGNTSVASQVDESGYWKWRLESHPWHLRSNALQSHRGHDSRSVCSNRKHGGSVFIIKKASKSVVLRWNWRQSLAFSKGGTKILTINSKNSCIFSARTAYSDEIVFLYIYICIWHHHMQYFISWYIPKKMLPFPTQVTKFFTLLDHHRDLDLQWNHLKVWLCLE